MVLKIWQDVEWVTKAFHKQVKDKEKGKRLNNNFRDAKFLDKSWNLDFLKNSRWSFPKSLEPITEVV